MIAKLWSEYARLSLLLAHYRCPGDIRVRIETQRSRVLAEYRNAVNEAKNSLAVLVENGAAYADAFTGVE